MIGESECEECGSGESECEECGSSVRACVYECTCVRV